MERVKGILKRLHCMGKKCWLATDGVMFDLSRVLVKSLELRHRRATHNYNNQDEKRQKHAWFFFQQYILDFANVS